MTHERDSESRLGCRDRQPHHISSIVHHFLDEELDEKLDEELDENLDETKEKVPVPEIAFSGLGHGSLVAWVCAATVRHLVDQRVLLAESSRLSWSAISFLQDVNLVESPEPDHPAVRPGEESNFWTNPVAEAPSSRLSAQPCLATPELLLRNLGALNNRQLSQLEAASLQSSSLGGMTAGSDLVLWCLTPSEARSLGGAYTLGRALALMKPRHLEIVVFPKNFLQGTSPHNSEDPRIWDEELDHRCRQLVATVAATQSCGFSLVIPDSSSGLASPHELLASILDRLLGVNDSD